MAHRPKYEWQEHHFDHLHQELDNGKTYGIIYKEWPFRDMIDGVINDLVTDPGTGEKGRPSRDSVRKRAKNRWIREGNINYTNAQWTEEEEKDLILAYTLCEGSMEEIEKLYKECDMPRSPNAIVCKVQELQSEELLPRYEHNHKATVRYKDWTEHFLKCGLEVIGNSYGGAFKTYKVQCLAFGHKQERKASTTHNEVGCKFCSAAGKVSLSVLKDLPEGKLPCVTYCVEFRDGVIKVGHANKGAEKRGKGWPPFKILKEIYTTTYHARRIEVATHHDFERIKLYEPIAGNGGTECFQPIYKQSILKYLEEEERNLPEDAKNIT